MPGRHLSPSAARPSGRRAGSLTLTLGLVLGSGVTAAAPGLAAPTTLARAGYTAAATGAWYNDTPLGRTASTDQYAQAQVAGLTAAAQQAGFLMRYADRTNRVQVTVSGTGWSIVPTAGPSFSGTFAHGPAGLFRVEVQGQSVRVRWNGALVASRTVSGGYPGAVVVPTVRQARPGVTLRLLQAGSPSTAGGSAAAAAAPPPARTSAARTWLSGASGDHIGDGRYGAWRGSAIQIAGTWSDTYEAQAWQWSVCPGGGLYTWNKPVDLAFGGIFRSRGDTWAAAAAGAYDARWTTALQRLRTCWGRRDTGLLYLRFAHEMNLRSSDWWVLHGEEASFVRALGRFSALRYRILPGAKVVLCPNYDTDGSLGDLDVRTLWPGRDGQGRRIADVYAVDAYNQYPHAVTAAQFTSKINATYSDGAPLGIERHRQFAQKIGVPFAVAEWSNNGRPGADGGGGESPTYVRMFNAWARSHAGNVARPVPGQLLYEVQFDISDQFEFWPSTIQPATAAAYRSLPWGR